MKNEVITNADKNTISGTFHIERGGRNGGELKATIEINDMSPQEFSNIDEMINSITKEVIYGVTLHAINP